MLQPFSNITFTLHIPTDYNILLRRKSQPYGKKIKKNLKALLNLKPVIAAALITAASSIALALFSSDKLILKVEANELQSAVGVEPSPEKETISRLRTELNSRVSAAALHDLSDTYFPENAGTAAIKDTIRMLVRHADTYRADRKHYTYRMFRLKRSCSTCRAETSTPG